MWSVIVIVYLTGFLLLIWALIGSRASLPTAGGSVFPELLQDSDNRLGMVLRDIALSDERQTFAYPQESAIHEDVVIRGRRRTMLLDTILSRSHQSVIMTVRSEPGTVVKYQTNCLDLDGLHPLVRDYVFLREVEDLGVTPHAHFLSPPVKFLGLTGPKTQFRMSLREKLACVENRNSTLRYMVMDRVAGTVHGLIRSYENDQDTASVKETIGVMIEAIEAIQRIHSRGIVHGDVHSGNFAFIDRNGKRTVGLIDFGNAFFVDETAGLDPLPFEPFRTAHCLLSHWNIRGFRFGMRDDVFKTLMTGAYLLNGPAWMWHCESLHGDAKASARWKAKGFLFTIPGATSKLYDLPVGTRRGVIDNLRRALDLARSVELPDDTPPYRAILDSLSAARRFLD